MIDDLLARIEIARSEKARAKVAAIASRIQHVIESEPIDWSTQVERVTDLSLSSYRRRVEKRLADMLASIKSPTGRG